MSPVHIFLVENDLHWRDRLWSSISVHPDLQMVGAVCSKEEALDHFFYADVVIIDSEIEGIHMEGLRLAKEMNRLQASRIILLTDRYDIDAMLDGMLAGVSRFVSKSDYQELPRIIREVSARRIESDLSTA